MEEERFVPVERPVSPQPVRPVAVPSWPYRLERLVWFCTGLICVLIAIRFFLRAFAADTGSPFVAAVYGITGPLTMPFYGIFPGGGVRAHVFEPACLVAFVVYLLVGWGVAALIRILAPTSRTIPT
jgi:hypothetical protein